MRSIIISLVFSVSLWAESYALIIGVNNYKNINGLSGAVNDALALDKLLKKHHIDHRYLLTDKKANKQSIISTLKKIALTIQKDDKFYMFFSGHGTSLSDPDNKKRFQKDKRLLTLLENSGALIPYDYNPSNPLTSLIIGSRDLKPSFQTIDKKGATSMIAFDACFSGMTYRSAPSKRTRRRHYQPPKPIGFTTVKSHPYQNLVYVASTSSSDWAVENQKKNRGFLTQRMEICLDGLADNNNNYKISKQELKHCIDNANLPQVPQIYPKAKEQNPTVFKLANKTNAHSRPSALNIEKINNRYRASDDFSILTPLLTKEQTERYKKAHKIIQLNGKKQFSLIALNKEGEKQKMVKVGDNISLEIETEKEGYLVLLDLDSEGNLYILEPTPNNHPFFEADEKRKYTDLTIAEPVGVELLKGFIISDFNVIKKIQNLDGINNMGKVADVTSLYRILTQASSDTALLKLTSYKN